MHKADSRNCRPIKRKPIINIRPILISLFTAMSLSFSLSVDDLTCVNLSFRMLYLMFDFRYRLKGEDDDEGNAAAS